MGVICPYKQSSLFISVSAFIQHCLFHRCDNDDYWRFTAHITGLFSNSVLFKPVVNMMWNEVPNDRVINSLCQSDLSPIPFLSGVRSDHSLSHSMLKGELQQLLFLAGTCRSDSLWSEPRLSLHEY